MINFFRKIRQQLLAQNRLRNYILYAVGEILLVVIGILIALAINNYQADRQKRQKEQIYLRGLYNDFVINKTKLERLIEVNQENYTGVQGIIRSIDSDTLISERDFAHLLYGSFAQDIYYNPNNSLLQEIIHSGSLRDLSNPELRRQLTMWVATLEDISQQERELSHQREQVLGMFYDRDYSIRTIVDLTGVSQSILDLPAAADNHSNLPILSDREFENKLLTFWLTCRATELNHYIPLMDDIENILSILDSAD